MTVIDVGTVHTLEPDAAASPLLSVEHLSRSFGEVRALNDVSLHVRRQEVVGLVGENGAGKSTLLNILCGVDRADDGIVRLQGREVHFRNYNDATHHGVFRIFQDLALVPSASVYENLFLSHENRFQRAGVIQTRRMRAKAAELLERFGHGWIDPGRAAWTYDFSVRQVIEIIKAFALAELLEIETPVILLDEPTTGLSESEVRFFHDLVRQVKDHAGVVFVSHRLSEVLEFSDRLYILKDGTLAGEADPATCSEEQLHVLMVGRRRQGTLYKETVQRAPADEVVLEVSGYTQKRAFSEVDLALYAGEILGIGGVIGSGKSQLARAMFGDGKASGELRVHGLPYAKHSVRQMIEAGVGYVSPDRAADGVITIAPVSWNISLAALATADQVLIPLGREEAKAAQQITNLSIKTPSPRTPIGQLSGGNQQKAILGRWLSTGTNILILDNPTAGIDVGAREDIYATLRRFVEAGGAILLVSDDLPELIGLSNRVLAMKDGRVVAEVAAEAGAKPSETDILRHMV